MPFVAALVPEVDIAGGRVVIADRPGLVQPLPEDDETPRARGRALMRLDYLTIFPDYLAPLQLSLPGKAVESGLLEVHVHDLRSWTHDRHHTVDDTPYGGGAGMVMKPEPWGEAFAALDIDASDTIVFTTPSGDRFDQRKAEELSARPRLIFACGRYEGIDQRVLERAREIAQVEEISLGDYVLNGGEVAALAITEAVVRLLPGFMGNAESLVEESHADRRAACWSTPSTPSRRSGRAVRSPTCCGPATTARSPGGATSRRVVVRRSAGPTCSRRRRSTTARRSSARCRPTRRSC